MRRFVTVGAVAALCSFGPLSVAAGHPYAAARSSRHEAAGQQGLWAPTPGARARADMGTGTATRTLVVEDYNWSGYALVTKRRRTFTGVTATYVVTTVDTNVPGSQYSSDWVGVDGVNDGHLIQAGVEEDNLGGTAFYQAWTEVLPSPEDPLSLAVKAGDLVTATVRETAPNTWTMTVADATTGASASRIVSRRIPGKSVEAVHERPCLGACSSLSDLATLATTTDQTFDPAQFTSSPPGSPPAYAPLLVPTGTTKLYDMAMVADDGQTVLATPSTPSTDQEGFSVADGGAAPPPPVG